MSVGGSADGWVRDQWAKYLHDFGSCFGSIERNHDHAAVESLDTEGTEKSENSTDFDWPLDLLRSCTWGACASTD